MVKNTSIAPVGKYALWVCALVVVVFLGLESWSTWRMTKESSLLLDTLATAPPASLADEKIRQEVISLRLKNEQQRVFISSLVSNLSVTVGLLAAISGGWIAFHQYIRTRTRERLDRAAIDFAALWEGLSSDQQDKRAGSIAALADYLTEDKADFHDRVASALALVGRMKNKQIVNRTLTPVIELVMRRYPDSARSVSWQSLKLFRVNFSNAQLRELDLRDADLREADFRGTQLEGVRFDAARLIGAVFDGANLRKANLAYADLAEASMRGADLRDADMRNIQLLDLDLNGADLRGAGFAPHATDWRLIKNWRNAIMDKERRDSLIELYGPAVHGPRILMLTWEYPPFVFGGGWTAVYHLLTSLRQRGAHLTVVVPLPSSLLDRSIFGNEIEVIGVGNEANAKSLADSSPYDNDGVGTTVYEKESAIRKTKEQFQEVSPSSTLMDLVMDFQLRAMRAVDAMKVDCDLIHAHDWLTFPAAATIAATLSRPWIAQFHSTEEDRQPGDSSPRVLKLEREACRSATRIVAVSNVTARRLIESYQVSPERIDVVPNCLAGKRLPSSNLGAFNGSRVVFLGRLTQQKGIDRFVDLAKELRSRHVQAEFHVYGSGPERGHAESAASEQHSYIPPAEEVPPLKESEINLGIRHVDFLHIAAASKNNEGRYKLRAISINDAKKKALFEEEIFRRGFTAEPIESPPYTHLIHVHNCPADLHPDYAARIDALPTISRRTTHFVAFHGSLPWADRFKAFDQASVVVVPSRFEPFGLVVLEAMSHGVPVVYPKSSGAAEVIRSGVQFETLEHAIEGTLQLLSDEKYWREIVEAQLDELSEYPKRGYEALLQAAWNHVLAPIGRTAEAV